MGGKIMDVEHREPNRRIGHVSLDNSSDQIFRTWVRWLVILGASAFGAVFTAGMAITITSENWIIDLAREHFAATIGLPFAALASLCLVILLEITAGNIEIKGPGFEFKGAGGPIIMWTVCFLAIAFAIKLLW